MRYHLLMRQDDSRTALEDACAIATAAGVCFALIGGHAVNLYARPRATVDVDFLVAGNDAVCLRDALVEVGFEVLDWRDEIASFVRGPQRIDMIVAQGTLSQQFLADAEVMAGAPCPVVSAEALISLKLQAFNNDPRRLQDLVDIKSLVDCSGGSLDLTLLRSVFELFDRARLFDELFPQDA
ncbi:MAG: hypothetical protein AAGA95_04105 [Pseudomonadota bacterium]